MTNIFFLYRKHAMIHARRHASRERERERERERGIKRKKASNLGLSSSYEIVV